MWVASRRKRWSCFVPVAFLLLASGMLAVSFGQLKRAPSLGVAVSCLLCAAISVFVLGQIRLARARGSRLSVVTLFGRRELDVVTTVVSVVTAVGSRGGVRHEVVATDASGGRTILAELWSQRGAERARASLAQTFEELGVNDAREQLRAGLAEALARDEDARAQAVAQVQQYYSSGRHRRSIYVIAAVLVLYVVGTAIYVFLSGGSL
jgi:hypothetical protein